jgi:hypothetical protein
LSEKEFGKMLEKGELSDLRSGQKKINAVQ